jgi:hypothetical protein
LEETKLNPKKSLEELELQGSPNIQRTLQRQKAEGKRPPLSAERKSEIATLDELIRNCMNACKRGQTVDGRPNPSFANLATLVKVRKQLLDGHTGEMKKSSQEILDEANKLIGVN